MNVGMIVFIIILAVLIIINLIFRIPNLIKYKDNFLPGIRKYFKWVWKKTNHDQNDRALTIIGILLPYITLMMILYFFGNRWFVMGLVGFIYYIVLFIVFLWNKGNYNKFRDCFVGNIIYCLIITGLLLLFIPTLLIYNLMKLFSYNTVREDKIFELALITFGLEMPWIVILSDLLLSVSSDVADIFGQRLAIFSGDGIGKMAFILFIFVICIKIFFVLYSRLCLKIYSLFEKDKSFGKKKIRTTEELIHYFELIILVVFFVITVITDSFTIEEASIIANVITIFTLFILLKDKFMDLREKNGNEIVGFSEMIKLKKQNDEGEELLSEIADNLKQEGDKCE